MPTPRDVHRGGTRFMSALLVVVGIAMVVRTIAGTHGGGVPLGIPLGILFVLAGAGRFYLARSPR